MPKHTSHMSRARFAAFMIPVALVVGSTTPAHADDPQRHLSDVGTTVLQLRWEGTKPVLEGRDKDGKAFSPNDVVFDVASRPSKNESDRDGDDNLLTIPAVGEESDDDVIEWVGKPNEVFPAAMYWSGDDKAAWISKLDAPPQGIKKDSLLLRLVEVEGPSWVEIFTFRPGYGYTKRIFSSSHKYYQNFPVNPDIEEEPNYVFGKPGDYHVSLVLEAETESGERVRSNTITQNWHVTAGAAKEEPKPTPSEPTGEPTSEPTTCPTADPTTDPEPQPSDPSTGPTTDPEPSQPGDSGSTDDPSGQPSDQPTDEPGDQPGGHTGNPGPSNPQPGNPGDGSVIAAPAPLPDLGTVGSWTIPVSGGGRPSSGSAQLVSAPVAVDGGSTVGVSGDVPASSGGGGSVGGSVGGEVSSPVDAPLAASGGDVSGGVGGGDFGGGSGDLGGTSGGDAGLTDSASDVVVDPSTGADADLGVDGGANTAAGQGGTTSVRAARQANSNADAAGGLSGWAVGATVVLLSGAAAMAGLLGARKRRLNAEASGPDASDTR